MRPPLASPSAVPIFYGWIVIAVAFVTMGIGVNARTVFSLLFPPILDEFSWPRGLTAGAFSFGLLVSGILGRLIDRRGPRAVMLLGVAMPAQSAGGCGARPPRFIREASYEHDGYKADHRRLRLGGAGGCPLRGRV